MGEQGLGAGADVRQLLGTVGLERFPYRELGAARRLRALADPDFLTGEELVGDAAAQTAEATTAAAGVPRPDVHQVLVLSRWQRAGCTLLASHLAHALQQQGRSARCISAIDVANAPGPTTSELEIVDGSGSAAATLGLGEPELHGELARRAHTVIAVLSCREGVARGLLRLCRVLHDAGAPAPFLVLNHYDPRRAEDRRIFASLQLHVAGALLPWALSEDPAVQVAQEKGRAVFEDAPDSQTGWALQQISTWLADRHDRGEWFGAATRAVRTK